jgi:hypothetical protein
MCRGFNTVIAGVLMMVLSGQMTALATGARSARVLTHNAHVIYPITAMMTFADGTTEKKHGQGFIVGNRLFTVYHTIAPRMKSVALIKRDIYVAGTLMTPVYTHAAHDIAIFEIPNTLCEPRCNTWVASDLLTLNRDRQIYWMQEAEGKHLVKAGRVQHYAWLSDAPPALNPGNELPCQQNLIVEVDTPFRPGTSGSPVFDAATDVIVGMIQGSLTRADRDTGYFKPLACLLSLSPL